MKAKLKNPTVTLTKSEKQTVERFARACGVTLDLALAIRDDLRLVALDLPKLGSLADEVKDAL